MGIALTLYQIHHLCDGDGMVRPSRLMIPGIPYRVTQRGNRRAQTFFEGAGYALYRDLLAQITVSVGAGL